MKMGSVDDNKLLKIIYPGGRVDLYDRPVTAREIMNQHPKDCIARTDFFRVPWFVVSPESTLMPGMQFLLVPKYTIKRLLKVHSKPVSSIDYDTKKITTATKKVPSFKESSNSASKRSSTIQTDQQKEKRVYVSHKRRGCSKLCCLPLVSESMAEFKVSPELFVRHVPYMQFTPPPPQTHPLDQAPDSYKGAKPNRRVAFTLPTAGNIRYYTPSPISPGIDAATASTFF